MKHLFTILAAILLASCASTRYASTYDESRDSIRMEKPVYIEKPRRWYETGLMWSGGLCCISVIMWALFLYLKRKF